MLIWNNLKKIFLYIMNIYGIKHNKFMSFLFFLRECFSCPKNKLLIFWQIKTNLLNESIRFLRLPATARTKLTKPKISQSEVIYLTKSLQLLSTSKDPTPYTYACGEVSSSPCVLLKIKRAFSSTRFSFHHNFH